jgi:RNA polymerase sigma-70 factor (ECF subfamily)
MAEERSFGDLIRGVRARDAGAMAELTRRYLPAIKRVVHARLTDPGLRRLLDSIDICQSVFLSFMVRVSAGQYQLDSEAQLFKLLEAMARHKLATQAEKQGAARRDYRRLEAGPVEERDLPGVGPDPSAEASYRELLTKFQGCLTAEERRLADLRAQNWTWKRIAAEVNGQPDALRMQLARAIDRCTRALGLED